MESTDPLWKGKILLSSAAEDISLTLEEKFLWVPFQNMHNLAKLGRNEKRWSERWSTILWRLLQSTARKRKSHKVNDQWVEFQEANKIQEANTSACEQINQPDITLMAGKHAQGVTKGLESLSLYGCPLPTSKVPNLDHAQSAYNGPGIAQNAAQHKLNCNCSSRTAQGMVRGERSGCRRFGKNVRELEPDSDLL